LDLLTAVSRSPHPSRNEAGTIAKESGICLRFLRMSFEIPREECDCSTVVLR
jgi:hypothetical protein